LVLGLRFLVQRELVERQFRLRRDRGSSSRDREREKFNTRTTKQRHQLVE